MRTQGMKVLSYKKRHVNDVSNIEPLAPNALSALKSITPGQVVEIAITN
jgi:hypothetical protein